MLAKSNVLNHTFPMQMHNSLHKLDKAFIFKAFDNTSSPMHILYCLIRIPYEGDNLFVKAYIFQLYLLDCRKHLLKLYLLDWIELHSTILMITLHVIAFVQVCMSFINKKVNIFFCENINFQWNKYGTLSIKLAVFNSFMTFIDEF